MLHIIALLNRTSVQWIISSFVYACYLFITKGISQKTLSFFKI